MKSRQRQVLKAIQYGFWNGKMKCVPDTSEERRVEKSSNVCMCGAVAHQIYWRLVKAEGNSSNQCMEYAANAS
jgi:hypothetical protein